MRRSRHCLASTLSSISANTQRVPEPTPVLRRVVELKAIDQPASFVRFKCLVERRWAMCIEIIQHHDELVSFRILDIRQLPHRLGPINARPPVSDMYMPLASQRLKEHEEGGYSFSFVFVGEALYLPSFSQQRCVLVGDELCIGFIHAPQWALGIVRLRLNSEPSFHAADKLSTGLRWNAPLLFQPRLQFIFLSVVRIVSWEMCSTEPSCMKRRFKSRNVQRSCPSGG